MTSSLRIIAVIASFLHFPDATNWSYFVFMSGLKRVATNAGKYNYRRISARQPRMCSRPCHFPDCRVIGARPAAFIICLLSWKTG
jgi:hypothetical protein